MDFDSSIGWIIVIVYLFTFFLTANILRPPKVWKHCTRMYNDMLKEEGKDLFYGKVCRVYITPFVKYI